MKENRTVAAICLAICTLFTSLGWMYLRIPQYIEKFIGSAELAPWLLSAYIIAEVSVVIVAGVMADKIGSKSVTLLGVALFVGSAIGIYQAEQIELIIAYRVIQGAGAGFIFTIGLAFIPKAFTKSERLNPHKIMVLAFAVGSIFGTSAGYYFITNFNEWRSFFIISAIAVGVFGTIAYLTIPDTPRHHVRDVPGMILSILTIALIMTYSQIVGNDIELLSFESLALIELCLIIGAVLIISEKKTTDPIIPHGIQKNHIGLMAGMFLVGFCGLGMLQYLAMFMIVCYGLTIYQASCMVMVLILGGACTSLTGMHIVYRIGVRPLALLGPIIVMMGFAAGYFIISKGLFGVAVTLFVMGMGFGCMITEMLISLQAVVPVKHAGAHTGLLMSIRFMGIILGMAVYGSIIKGALKEYIYNLGYQVDDVITWMMNHYFECLDDLMSIFRDTIRECCIIAAITVLSALVITYLFVGKDDLDTPEYNDSDD